MRRILVAMCILALSSLAASAEVGVFGSYWKVEDGGDDGFGGGAKIQSKVAPDLFVELRGSYFPDFGGTEEADIDIIPAEADLIMKFPMADQMKLYGGVGGGYYMFQVDSNEPGVEFDIDDTFGAFAIAGLEIKMGNGVTLFGEGKYTYLTDVEVKGSSGDASAKEEIDLSGFGGNVGLMMKW